MSKARIAVYALGGTIAMVPGKEGVVPGLSADQLIAAVPGLREIAALRAETLSKVASPNLDLDGVLVLAARIRADAAEGATDGWVVTQGTDTIEETAFLLDLLLADLDRPVVVTGAMRNPLMVAPDGPANILNAVRLAASPDIAREAGALGVLVTLNDTIHAAAEVVKANTHRLDAFASPQTGPVGLLIEDRIVLTGTPRRPYRAAIATLLDGRDPATLIERKAPVLLVGVTVTDPGLLLAHLADRPDRLGYAGIVLSAMGGGHVPARLMAPVAGLAASLPVVMAGRVGNGPLLARTYEFAGSEMDLAQHGVLSAGRLHALKSCVLLELALRCGADRAAIARLFAGFA
ncbi:asparaginase [Oceanibaculum pacificum]|uniref:L-asparaginase n=1 Tax=Oceanibaculum pacificum TaxID=580166 RepID=A0A154W1G1_9PROT|nr:asparaginase [Oceanibaculum pacificum]KZD07287.1 hypothetical protein AUP43_10235 [Oceanibaculum pacificum]